MTLLPFEHAANAAECADCEGVSRCARHDVNPRCEQHGDYLAEDKTCAACSREAVHYDGCDRQCGGYWTCPGCERLVGNCCGANDEMPELCDSCWNDVTNAREAAQREAS